MAEEKKNQYRVKEGHVFGKDDEYQPGDIVELTEYEAKGFLDTLELVGGSEEAPAPKKAKKSEATG